MDKDFNPKVSIIIPVYNGENYLKEAIDSAIAQTYKNLEIIVVDDGSTDNTEKIAKLYGEKIKYLKKENGGTSTALNLGIKNMTGEYFSWLSHDDMYYPNKIERQIEELSELPNKNTIMMSDLDGIDEEYKEIYVTHYMDHIKDYPPRAKSYIHPIIYNQTHGCTLLIPKICFDEVGLFDERELVAQDFEFFYRAFLKFPHKLVPEVLVTARDSPNRQGRRSHSKGDVEYSRLFIKIIENLSEEDIKLLAPSKLDFYNDMRNFFYAANYTIALDYINKLLDINIQHLTEENETLNNENMKLCEKNETLNNENMKLCEKNETLNNENMKLCEKNETLNNENMKLCEKNETLNNENMKLCEKNETLNNENMKLCEKNETLNNENMKLCEKSENLNNENQNLKNQIASYENSNSWKITAPLRKLKRIVKNN